MDQLNNGEQTGVLIATYTRWFKYDRDKLWLVYTKIVPVVFEPPFKFFAYGSVSAW